MEYDRITFDDNGEVVDIFLTEATTQELKETGYAMVNDESCKTTYFVIIIDDDDCYVAKAVDYSGIKLYH